MLVFAVLMTIGLAAWLAFMFGFPRRWNALVDGENDFWTGKGVMPKSVSDFTRRFEKSLLFKSLVGAVFVYVLVITVLLAISA